MSPSKPKHLSEAATASLSAIKKGPSKLMLKGKRSEKPTFPKLDFLAPEPEPDANLHRGKTFLTAMDVSGLEMFHSIP